MADQVKSGVARRTSFAREEGRGGHPCMYTRQPTTVTPIEAL